MSKQDVVSCMVNITYLQGTKSLDQTHNDNNNTVTCINDDHDGADIPGYYVPSPHRLCR